MRTYAGYLVKGGERVNFEISAPNSAHALRQLHRMRLGWQPIFKESHNSVYPGRLGHPKVRKHKD